MNIKSVNDIHLRRLEGSFLASINVTKFTLGEEGQFVSRKRWAEEKCSNHCINSPLDERGFRLEENFYLSK